MEVIWMCGYDPRRETVEGTLKKLVQSVRKCSSGFMKSSGLTGVT